LIVQLLLALALTSLTVFLHALGTWVAITRLAAAWRRRKAAGNALGVEIHIVRVVGVLLLLHLLEAVIWALFYRVSGDLPDLETALYFSMTSYTTVGYGDVLLPAPWRILGPIESAVGILMFGWSTAILVAAITRLHANRLSEETPGEMRRPAH
jgi:voltage-gated potassium channel